MHTCQICETRFDGPPFGQKWSDAWCMPCWFQVQDGAAIADADPNPRVALADKEEELESAEERLEEVEEEIDTLTREQDELQERCEALEKAIAILKARVRTGPQLVAA